MTTTDSQAVPRTDAAPEPTVPLSSSEEEVVRRIASEGLPGDHALANVNVARLIVTLDAARAEAAVLEKFIAKTVESYNAALAKHGSHPILRELRWAAGHLTAAGWVLDDPVALGAYRAAASPTAHSAPPDPPKGERIGSLTPEDRKGLGRGWRAGKGNRALRGD